VINQTFIKYKNGYFENSQYEKNIDMGYIEAAGPLSRQHTLE